MKKILAFCLAVLLCAVSGTGLTETPQPEKPEAEYKVGDVVIFGSYEQDNDASNGKEPIEWVVLQVESDGTCLMISKYALDCKPYNAAQNEVTWETCTLRNWLNGSFYNTAFSSSEREKTALTKNANADAPIHGTEGGNDTYDHVFLLSLEETEKYYSIDKSTEPEWYWNGENRLIKTPTEYAKAQGARSSVYNEACLWWLRSPGSAPICATSVFVDGSVSIGGGYVDNNFLGVVPAVRVRLF